MLRAGFGCTVLAHDLADFSDFYAEHGIRHVDLQTLLKEADVVSLHLPLDPSTENILSAQRLASMKSGAVLINTARGGLVDEAALKNCLQKGPLAGANCRIFWQPRISVAAPKKRLSPWAVPPLKGWIISGYLRSASSRPAAGDTQAFGLVAEMNHAHPITLPSQISSFD